MIERPYLTHKAFSSQDNRAEVLRRIKHQYIHKVHNHRNRFTVTREQYQSYFKFTIVRNPWARTFSWYKNVMRDGNHLKEHGITTEMSFKEFLIQFAGKGMLRSQLYWLKSFDGSIPLDYIGRFENLLDDLHDIFKRLDLKDLTLPHKRAGTKEDYRKYFDDEANDIILDAYKEEIDIFDYSFDSKC